MPKAVIFDFDGLILDTEVAVYEAWADLFRHHGQELPLLDYVRCVGGGFSQFDPRTLLQNLVEDRVDWERWEPWVHEEALQRANLLQPLPGVLDLLGKCAETGMPCVVASSSPRSWVEGHLGRLGLLEFFLGTCCAEDVASIKPDPDLFQAALKKAEAGPGDAVILEDSLNGLQAALAARVDCIIVPNRITSHLTFVGARAVVLSLADESVHEMIFA